ncbi:MAG: hypothetical protein HYX24_04340 [Candidatus Aenigmarchaeota archaeon]|nr:hypothetical protein [Candidatus Aenigmarchaeota archaeon]
MQKTAMVPIKAYRKETLLVPVRITQEQNRYLQEFVEKGMFSSRQDAIRFMISEKMLREK